MSMKYNQFEPDTQRRWPRTALQVLRVIPQMMNFDFQQKVKVRRCIIIFLGYEQQPELTRHKYQHC